MATNSNTADMIMEGFNKARIREPGMSSRPTVSKLARLPTREFDHDVTSVVMNESFILIGRINGNISIFSVKNGNIGFSTKVSDNAITAVCCEEQDEADNPIFYAGDEEGKLFTVNKKGKVVAEAKLAGRKGKILAIVNRSKYSIYAHTCGGSTSFSHATTDFRKRDLIIICRRRCLCQFP